MTSNSNYKSVAKSVTTGGVELAALNDARSALILFNQGAEDVKVYFDNNSSVYFVMAAGKGMHFPEPPINQVNAVTDSGTATVSVLEA
jgi:hypothetical protein